MSHSNLRGKGSACDKDGVNLPLTSSFSQLGSSDQAFLSFLKIISNNEGNLQKWMQRKKSDNPVVQDQKYLQLDLTCWCRQVGQQDLIHVMSYTVDITIYMGNYGNFTNQNVISQAVSGCKENKFKGLPLDKLSLWCLYLKIILPRVPQKVHL